MRNPYGQSQNAQQQIMANQQALASYQIPQSSNNMEAIMGLIGKVVENMPEGQKKKPKTEQKVEGKLETKVGNIFGNSNYSNPNLKMPKFMNY